MSESRARPCRSGFRVKRIEKERRRQYQEGEAGCGSGSRPGWHRVVEPLRVSLF